MNKDQKDYIEKVELLVETYRELIDLKDNMSEEEFEAVEDELHDTMLDLSDLQEHLAW